MLVSSVSLFLGQPIILYIRWVAILSPFFLVTKKLEEKLVLALYPKLYQNIETEKPFLWEQIGWTLNVAVEPCAFITLWVVSLLFCVIKLLITNHSFNYQANANQNWCAAFYFFHQSSASSQCSSALFFRFFFVWYKCYLDMGPYPALSVFLMYRSLSTTEFQTFTQLWSSCHCLQGVKAS